jgi:Flp pilus assembly protein TadG
MPVRRVRGEAGTAAETVVIFPVFIVLLLMIVQYALWLHASHVALAAAQEGARVARMAATNGPNQEQQGEAKARSFLGALGPNIISNPQVSGFRTNDVAHVDVTGAGTSIIPGFTFRIHKSSEGPVERFRARTDP